MASAQMGGGYNALMAKKSKKTGNRADNVQADGRAGDSKRPAQGGSQPAATKSAKVLSLKESNAVQGKKDYKPAVQEEPAAKAAKKADEPVQKKTTAEEKKEREKTDRHVPRTGKSPARGSKGDDSAAVIAADESAAAGDDPAAAAEARAAKRETVRLSKEDEEEKKKREEEERQITYDDYLKKQKEMQKDLPQAQAARTVDQKAFAKFTVAKKVQTPDSALSFDGLGKAPAAKPAAAARGKGKEVKVVEKAAGKSKPKKMNELLSFAVSDAAPKREGKGKGKGKGGGKGGGGGAPPRGGPEWDQESKVDSDGATRTKREFVSKYGGFSEWDKATAPGAPAAAAPASAEPEAETW